MKLSNFLILVFLFLGVAAFGQSDLDCKKFKTGTFYSYSDGKVFALVKRKKRKQIETLSGTKAKIKMKVVWLDECTYKLIFIKANKAAYGLLEEMGQTKEEFDKELERIVICKITHIYGDEYTYGATYEDEKDFHIEGRIKKVK